MFSVLMTSAKAKSLGCTHYGMLWGIVPGFINPEQMLWIPRSDLLVPLEMLIDFIAIGILGKEEIAFLVGREI